jgi:hypothetical protein
MEYIVSGGGLYGNLIRTGKDFLYFLVCYIILLFDFILAGCTAMYSSCKKSIFDSITTATNCDLSAIFKKFIFVISLMRALLCR